MNIRVSCKVILGCAVLSLPMSVLAEFSGNLGVVSLYKDRGVDQEARNESTHPALQGGLDYDFENGLYVGNWNSTGRFGNAAMEVDLYGGYRTEFGDGWGLDFGYIQYVYPGEGSWNAGELYASIGYKGLMFKVYRGTRKDVNRNDMYYRLSYTHPLMDGLDVIAATGYQDYYDSDSHGKFDYSIGLKYSLNKHISISGTVSGANRRGDVDDHSRDPRFILGLSTVF